MKKYMTIEEYYKTQSQSGKKNSKKKILRHSFGILCLIIILFSLNTIFKWYKDNSKIRQINQQISKTTDIDIVSIDGELVNPPINEDSNYYYYITFPFYQADFKTLLKDNEDTVAFIKMKNTNINYPVVQAKDNKYYLAHSFDKKANSAGWVFMDYRSNIDTLADNTVIYGHARLDKTMFGSLRYALSSNWQKDLDNYVIYLSTLKENMIFQIFSIYTIKSENYYITPNFDNKNDKQKWINTMKKRNTAPIDTEVNVNDKFLTLSTCQNNQGGRIVVHAKLIKRQKIKNS